MSTERRPRRMTVLSEHRTGECLLRRVHGTDSDMGGGVLAPASEIDFISGDSSDGRPTRWNEANRSVAQKLQSFEPRWTDDGWTGLDDMYYMMDDPDAAEEALRCANMFTDGRAQTLDYVNTFGWPGECSPSAGRVVRTVKTDSPLEAVSGFSALKSVDQATVLRECSLRQADELLSGCKRALKFWAVRICTAEVLRVMLDDTIRSDLHELVVDASSGPRIHDFDIFAPEEVECLAEKAGGMIQALRCCSRPSNAYFACASGYALAAIFSGCLRTSGLY